MAHDHIKEFAQKVGKNGPESSILVWIEVFLILLDFYQKCRDNNEDDERSSVEMLQQLAADRDSIALIRTRWAIRRKKLARGPRNIKAMAERLLADVAAAKPEEVANILKQAGMA